MTDRIKWMLNPDLKTIREMATMWNPDFRDYDQGAHYHHAKRRYDAHVASLKSHSAENFTPEYAGKELEEGKDFNFGRGKQTHFTDQQQWQQMNQDEKDQHFEKIATPIKKIPSNIIDEIEGIVKKLSEKSTAPDKEFPDWMETDIRNGAIEGYLLAQRLIVRPLSNTANPKGEEKMENNQQIPEWAKTLAEKEYPNGTFGAEMCRQAYIKGLLQSPYGKCREALEKIAKMCIKYYQDSFLPKRIHEITSEALTLDSREDQDEFDERELEEQIFDDAKTSALILNWYDGWCERTKRNGGVLITTSIKELLTDFYDHIHHK